MGEGVGGVFSILKRGNVFTNNTMINECKVVEEKFLVRTSVAFLTRKQFALTYVFCIYLNISVREY